MRRGSWVWMPHPAHFICASDCKFHLATYVGGYIVSTVGELFPDAPVREVLAESRKVKLEGIGDARKTDYARKIGFETIGCDRLYETMVFKAKRRDKKPSAETGCCPWQIDVRNEVDFAGYNDPLAATKGHMRLCQKWSKPKAIRRAGGEP